MTRVLGRLITGSILVFSIYSVIILAMRWDSDLG